MNLKCSLLFVVAIAITSLSNLFDERVAYAAVVSPYTVTPTKDNVILAGSPVENLQLGTATVLGAGRNASPNVNETRSILTFDVSALASQPFTVQTITLTLTGKNADDTDTAPNASFVVDIHEPVATNQVWGELTSTWITRDGVTAWTGGGGLGSPGGGGYGAVLASQTITGVTPPDTLGGVEFTFNFTGDSAALTALVNSWANNPNNANFLVRPDDYGALNGTQLFLFSALNGGAAPELTITFVPEPSSLLLAFGGAFVWCLMRRRQ